MNLRLAFWTPSMPYSLVLVLRHYSLRSPGQLLVVASMAAILGVVFTCVFAHRARRRARGVRYAENTLRSHASVQDRRAIQTTKFQR